MVVVTFYFGCIGSIDLGKKCNFHNAKKNPYLFQLLYLVLKFSGSCKSFLMTAFSDENITVLPVTAGLLTSAIKSSVLVLYHSSA